MVVEKNGRDRRAVDAFVDHVTLYAPALTSVVVVIPLDYAFLIKYTLYSIL